ncbi:sulfotransferase family 2 domain-containing protein [Microbulbifer sp. JMSA004]|uniref:sulfotransferase family 2 domain-containing protein n=1 Tax=unclassified Microbulbifer TaxID=2619833 RepID=UPI00403AFEE3
MIVSDSKKFTFIHNPKCAGTTVRNSLYQFDTRDNFFWMFDEFKGRKIDKAHLPLILLRDIYPEEFMSLTDHFTFGFVRNPYDRVLSAFNEVNKGIYERYNHGEVSDSDYRRYFLDYVYSMNSNTLNGFDLRYRHCVKQKDMFYIGGKRYVDLILKLESISKASAKFDVLFPDLSLVSVRWGSQERAHNRKPVRKRSIELLDKKGRDIVSSLYAEDFELFGYEI